MGNTVSRRNFLRSSMVTLGALGIAACGATPTATPAPKAAAPAATAAPAPTVAKEASKIYRWYGAPLCGLDGSNAERLAAVQKYIKEQINVEMYSINAPPVGTAYDEKLNLLLASKSEPIDIFEGDWSNYVDYIQPLDDLLAKHGQNILKGNTKAAWATMKDSKGVTWGYPRLGVMAHCNPVWFRSDWLKELGLKTPTTWEEMEAAIEAFKKAKPDSVVLTNGLADLERCTLGGLTEYGVSKWIDPADKMMKPHFLQPGYSDWVAKMAEWWKKGYFQKESFANVDLRAVLKTLTVGVYVGWYSRITIWWEQIRTEAKLAKEDFEFPRVIKGPKGLMRSNVAGSLSAYMISKKCKDPAAAIQIADWIYKGLPDNPHNLYTARHGILGTDWDWADSAKTQCKVLIGECGKKYAADFYTCGGMGTEPYLKIVDATGKIERQTQHVIDNATDYDNGKMPIDSDVAYDVVKIREQFPGLADFDRLAQEETIKFITGQRPMTDWNSFVNQVKSAGLEQWSKAYTAQYRLYHP